MTLNLTVNLEESAKAYPEKTALILGEHKMTYAELRGAAKKFANGLVSSGVREGDKVALMAPNVPQWVVAYYGILNAGASVVPMNVLLKTGEVSYYLEDSDAKALVVWESFLGEAKKGFDDVPGCKDLIVIEAPGGSGAPEGTRSFDGILAENPAEFDSVQTTPNDTAVVLYTSGTTGRPKGAELTHANMWMNAMVTSEKLFGLREDDVILGTLPLFHVFGQTCALNATIFKGATIALMPRFEPEAALKAIQGARVTVFYGVPTMYQYLLRYPNREQYDTSSLRLGVSGGAAMPVEVLRAFEEQFGVVILEGYGLSETSPVVCFNHLDSRRVGSIGHPVWGIELKTVDLEENETPQGEPGELVVRGHAVMKGYYKKPEATEKAMKDGWFHTGDIARVDEDGFIFIVDRVKDLIIRGGYNVYPREIEEVLYEHPGVAEAAVIGVPHEELGEEVRAVLVLKDGESATEGEIISFMKERVAAYKYPRSVVFMDDLPKTATGKILKRELVPKAQASPSS
jgi:long-chain acyl-CoA synthetase